MDLVGFKDFNFWCTVMLASLNKAMISLFKTSKQMALEAYRAFQVNHPPNSSSSWEMCSEKASFGVFPLILQRRKLGPMPSL